MDLTSHSFCIFLARHATKHRDLNIHGLACFPPAPGLSPCFSDMNTQKHFFTDIHFPTFTNWQPGRYHLSDVATPNSAILMERKKMCCFAPSRLKLSKWELGFGAGSTPLDSYLNHTEREARMDNKAMLSEAEQSKRTGVETR